MTRTPMKHMHLRLSQEDCDRVKAAAERMGITPGTFMRQAIQAALGQTTPRSGADLSPRQEQLFSLYRSMLCSFNRTGNLFATAVLRQHDPAPQLQAELRSIIAQLQSERDQLRAS